MQEYSNILNDENIKGGSRHKIIKVKGNLQDSVNSITLFYNSIKDLEDKLSKKNIDVNIYNFSTHGAYFEGSILTKIESINLDEFKNSINTLETKLKVILEDIKNRDFKTYIDFRSETFLILELLQNSDKFLNFILLNYYKIVIPYLNNHFNDIKLNQEYKKVQLKSLFLKLL